MKKGLYILALALFVTVASAPGITFAQLTLYDNFNSPTHLLDSNKWWGTFLSGTGIEVGQRIDAGKLRMTFRSFGGLAAANPAGTFFSSLGTPLRNDTGKTLQATIEIVDFAALSCPGNPDSTFIRAEIRGGFFNTGTPVPNSYLNDVHAGVIFVRNSNNPSLDAIDIYGEMGRCNDANCSDFREIQNRPLGAISCPGRICPPVTVRLTWDQAANTFRFLRVASPANIEQTVTYAYADNILASRRYRSLSVPQFVANCTAAAGGVRRGFMDVLFDNVYTAP